MKETKSNLIEKKQQHRVVELQKFDEELLGTLYEALGVVPIGESIHPVHGRIATNITQDTNKGKLMIRSYPKVMPEKLETGHPKFEIEALQYFASRGVNVPTPALFDKSMFFETEDLIIFGYYFIQGQPINQSDLSVDIASKVGNFLNTVYLPVSINYLPSGGIKLINSFAYILEIAERIESKHLGLKEMDIWNVMKKMTHENLNIINDTPVGVVHADFFFENILVDRDELGLIDFGDAYYGHLLHDVVIGAMEASVTEDEVWHLDMFGAFLREVSSFLISNNISFEQFIETLRVDCMRFSVYTIPFTVEEGKDLSENPYINRYKKLLEEDFVEQISDIFSNSSVQDFGNHQEQIELTGGVEDAIQNVDNGSSWSWCSIL